ELAALGRPAQPVLEGELAGNPRGHLFGIEEAAARSRSRLAPGGLGIAQEHVRVGTVAREQRESGARAHAKVTAREAEGLAEAGLQHLPRAAGEFALAFQVGMHDREAVGADARE